MRRIAGRDDGGYRGNHNGDDVVTEVGPKHPRIRDERYLAYLRRQPCCTCGSTDAVQAAHIRSGSLEYEKPRTGLGEKPSDRWAVSLCRMCHTMQHRQNELAFWKDRGLDPFDLAKRYYAKATAIGETNPGSTSKRKKRKTITPRGFGPSRPFSSRKFGA